MSIFKKCVFSLHGEAKGVLIFPGTDPDKHYISVYRSLAGIWIFFGLAWLALIFNIGARVMEHVFQLRHPAPQDQDKGEEPEKEEEGARRRAIQQGV